MSPDDRFSRDAALMLQGFYTEGQEIACLVPDVIRKEMERCESLAGFQLLHSTGGGTGAGLGASLLRRINEEFPDQILSTVSVLSSPKVLVHHFILVEAHFIRNKHRCWTIISPYGMHYM